MSDHQRSASLQPSDRNRLLGHLAELGHPDAKRRADAAIEAAELVESAGLSWEGLIGSGRPGGRAKPQVPEATDWRERVTALLSHPNTTPKDRAFLSKVLGWKKLGRDEADRLEEIAGRIWTGDGEAG